jgi:hypothetical protein
MRNLPIERGRDRRILSLLMDEARKSECDKKHASALVRGGKVLCISRNNDKSCILTSGVPNQHAEAAVLSRLLHFGGSSLQQGARRLCQKQGSCFEEEAHRTC